MKISTILVSAITWIGTSMLGAVLFAALVRGTRQLRIDARRTRRKQP